MAGLEGLASIIYHEKQQQGSMLCAQHALNSLLQGNYFTAPDLSQIANSLDILEESYDDANTGSNSTNMDDTGFFSVQVLENALNVWGLNLVRWRSEQMRPYQDHPHTQLAFILNFHQHWFTLRRFGHAEPSMDADPGDGHWFNLNSFLSAPEWVGKLYLGMVLQQAESEGYSVFAVAQSNPQDPLALNRTEADEIASTLPEPSHSSSSFAIPRLSTAREPAEPASDLATGSGTEASGMGVEGFEDEDMELQAALQASLMDGGDFVLPLHSGSGSGLASGTDIRTPTQQQPSLPPMAAHPPRNLQSLPPLGFQPLGFPPPPLQQQQRDAADPVAASMARNRMIMERMRREQEMALREQYEEEVARLDGAGVNVGSDVGAVATGAGTGIGTRTRGVRRTRAEEEEEEMVRRAIEESQASSGSGSSSNSSSRVIVNDIDDDEYAEESQVDEEMVYDSDGDEDYRPPPIQPPAQAPVAAPVPHASHRVYDDDDAELQAALKASLESAAIPDTSAPPPGTDDDEVASEASAEATQVQEQEEKVSVDEMRRRRLARFGG